MLQIDKDNGEIMSIPQLTKVLPYGYAALNTYLARSEFNPYRVQEKPAKFVYCASFVRLLKKYIDCRTRR